MLVNYQFILKILNSLTDGQIASGSVSKIYVFCRYHNNSYENDF